MNTLGNNKSRLIDFWFCIVPRLNCDNTSRSIPSLRLAVHTFGIYSCFDIVSLYFRENKVSSVAQRCQSIRKPRGLFVVSLRAVEIGSIFQQWISNLLSEAENPLHTVWAVWGPRWKRVQTKQKHFSIIERKSTMSLGTSGSSIQTRFQGTQR